jgi:hypothetical protein
MENLFQNEFLSGIRYMGDKADLEFRFSDANPNLIEKEVGSIRCNKIYAYKLNHNACSTNINEGLHLCYIGEVNLYEIENKNKPDSDVAQLTFGYLNNKDVPIDGSFSVLVMDGQITVAVACNSVDVVRCKKA